MSDKANLIYADKGVRIPYDLYDAMADVAKANDRSVWAEIRQACRAWIEQHQKAAA